MELESHPPHESTRADALGPRAGSARRPSDRTYGRLQATLIGLALAIVVYVILAAWVIIFPKGVTLRTLLLFILAFNALWWSVADRRFARFVRSPGRAKALRLTTAAFSLALNAPILYWFVAGRPPAFFDGGPTWYTAAVTLWHLSLVVLMPIVALVRLVGLGMAWVIRAASGRRSPRPEAVPVPAGTASAAPVDSVPASPSRREFLRTGFATVPAALLVAATATAHIQQGRLVISRHRLSAPWLPRALHGLTITQVSDIHLGRHYRTYMLPELVDKANSLASDLVFVTGDVVDMSNDYLPPALDAISQLTHRHGIFFCIGNHDQIDDRHEFIRLVRAKFPMLINARRSLDIAGERITLAGVDFDHAERPTKRYPGLLAHVVATMRNYDRHVEGPVIALAHHPHAFDALASAGVPLTFSGHTHGGQLMLTRPDRHPDVGIGPILFRYNRGFYYRGASTLFVSCGIGNWFPLRINAPAEVVQIQLTA